jgi:hypothetical protein
MKSRQEKTEFVHQVATYLQIVLENQQKKKWGQRKIIINKKKK